MPKRTLSFVATLAITTAGAFAKNETHSAADTPRFDMYVVGAPMVRVLEQVITWHNLDIKIEGGVDQQITSYRVHGDLSSILNDFQRSYEMTFFTFNDIVYASRAADITTKILKIEGATPDAAIESLRLSGLPVDRYSVAPVAQSDALVVSAPEEFIKITEALLLSMKPQQMFVAAPSVIVRRGVTISTQTLN